MMDVDKPVQWLKHKHACHKPVKGVASKSSGTSALRAGRKKLNAAQKALLPKQPAMTKLISASGKARMVRVG